MVVCYLCISLLLQTKDDFRFIIPYVEFSKEVKGTPALRSRHQRGDRRPDRRRDRNQLLDSQLIMPRFVIAELQAIADSSDRLRRSRGRRGLDILNRLRNNPAVDLQIYDRDLPEFAGQPVDHKLVLLAKHLEGKLVTNDYNLNKVARLHGVGVINLNDLANALKPVFCPANTSRSASSRRAKSRARAWATWKTARWSSSSRAATRRKQVHIAVTSVLQTSAGRMVFGKVDSVRSRRRPLSLRERVRVRATRPLSLWERVRVRATRPLSLWERVRVRATRPLSLWERVRVRADTRPGRTR